MTDSKDSTSLPSISRRTLISGAASVPLMLADAARIAITDLPSDSVGALWQNWRRVHRESIRLCHAWQRAEKEVVQSVGFPRVRVPQLAGGDLWAATADDLDAALADTNDTEELCVSLHCALDEQTARWNAAAEAAGLDAIEAEENAASAMREEIGVAIFAQASDTLLGVAAKLVVILAMGESCADDPEFPWPQLRSALSDVRRLGKIPDEVLAT